MISFLAANFGANADQCVLIETETAVHSLSVWGTCSSYGKILLIVRVGKDCEDPKELRGTMESHAHDEDSEIEGATAELASLRIRDDDSGANICTALRKEVGKLSDLALTPTYVENEIADDSEDDIPLIDLIPSTSNLRGGSRDRAGRRGSSCGGTRGRGRGRGGRTAASGKRNDAAVMQTFPTTVPDFQPMSLPERHTEGTPRIRLRGLQPPRPIREFGFYFPDSIIDKIVTNTNAYARSKEAGVGRRYEDLTRDELKR